MTSKNYCCVPGCVESDDGRQVLHVFPNPVKYPERFRSWVLAVGGDIVGLDDQYIYANRRVCHRHFAEEHCCRSNRLTLSAVPQKNLPGISAVTRFTFGGQEQRHSTGYNIGKYYPSTSRGRFDIMGPEYATTKQLKKNSPTAEKENEPPLKMQERVCDTETSIDNVQNPERLQSVKKTYDKKCAAVPGSSKEESQKPEHRTSFKRAFEEIDMNTLRSEYDTSLKRKKCEVDVNQSTSSGKIPTEPIGKIRRSAQERCTYKTKRMLLTAREEKVYAKLRKAQIKLSRFKKKEKKYLMTIKTAQSLLSNRSFVDAIDNMPNAGKILTLLQFREQKKKNKGRRFTVEEKIVSLSVLKQSPKAYRFLRKIFLLPAPQTLDKMVQKVVITPGINNQVFNQLTKKASKMRNDHKVCVLLFDEIALQAHINYDVTADQINGLVQEQDGQHPKFANHALVFMIRGLLKNYKQPIAYTFCSGATKALLLKKYIKEIIKKVSEAGFHVVATICDQGANNRSAINSLIEDTQREHLKSGKRNHTKNSFFVGNKEIIALYDPPHLLKGIRNNLLKYNLQYQNEQGLICVAKWEHIRLLYAENPAYNGIRIMPKLTEQHVIPEKIAKMKVKFASQIFSRTVASTMGYLADKGLLPAECKETADLLLLFDEIFDSMNGSYEKKGSHYKPYLSSLTPKSPHHKLWMRAKKTLSSMKFLTPTNQIANVPTVKNFKWTIESMEYLLQKINDEFNISSIWTRHLNQDPLENFFGSIRSHGCRNNNPSPAAFQSSFTALLINNLSSVHAAGANCEEDFCESLQTFVVLPTSNQSQVQEINMDHVFIDPTPLYEKNKDPKQIGSLTYVSGFFLKKCSERVFKNCSVCKRDLFDPSKSNEYLRVRDYSTRGWLCYPSEKFIYLISQIQDIVFIIIKNNVTQSYIKEYIKTLAITNIDFNNDCNTHKNLLEFIYNYVVKFFLKSYCNDINKILKGKRKQEDKGDHLQLLAENYFKSSLKSKKK